MSARQQAQGELNGRGEERARRGPERPARGSPSPASRPLPSPQRPLSPPGVLRWYEGRTVLVTGGAGFMGKVMLEKMLRSLPGLERVYLLLRAKRGVAPQRRLHDMFQLPVFERLRAEKPEALRKAVAVEGDLLQPGLGLSEEDRGRLVREVSVVFHGAATLRLEAEMAAALKHNVLGTRRVLDLATQMPLLEAFVHFSTAFCHPEEEVVEEKVYPAPVPPEELVKLGEWLSEDALTKLTPRLLGLHPNCYTFSKKLAEALVNEMRGKLPVAIVRPSIVTPTLSEPMPGWVDSLNGPIGVAVGAGKGVIRSMMCGRDYTAEVLPVDVAANTIIGTAWDTAVFRSEQKETPVYNATTGDVVRVTWGEVLDRGRRAALVNPFDWVVWYPDGDIRSSRMAHNLIVFFFHWLPAYFIDMVLFLSRNKTFMVRLQKRISTGMGLLEFFTMRQWHFRNDNALAVERRMSPEERRIFYISDVKVDVDEYLTDALLGARLYCMKEPLSTLPRARRHLKLMYAVHLLAKTMFWGLLLYFFVSSIEPLRKVLDTTSSGLTSNSFFRTLTVE